MRINEPKYLKDNQVIKMKKCQEYLYLFPKIKSLHKAKVTYKIKVTINNKLSILQIKKFIFLKKTSFINKWSSLLSHDQRILSIRFALIEHFLILFKTSLINKIYHFIRKVLKNFIMIESILISFLKIIFFIY